MTDTPKMIDSSTIPTVDDLSAPTILIDSISGIMSVNGVVIIGGLQTQLQVKSDADMAPVKKVVLRLAMPIGSLPSLVDMLQKHMQQMVSEGQLQVSANGPTEN